MASPPKSLPQDMPPVGGYGPLQWERIPLKTVFGVKLTIGLWLASTVIGSIGYFYNYKRIKKEEIEMRSATFAILPLLIAEKDRAFLKQVRENVEAEKELMKNVPEWELGTYFREPVYRTMPDQYHRQTYMEFTAHADPLEAAYRVFRRHYF